MMQPVEVMMKAPPRVTTTHTEPRARDSANDVTSGDDDEMDADDVLRVVERARVPVRKQFQEETATDWRARMQTRLQQLQESAQARESVAFRVPSGQVIGREYVRVCCCFVAVLLRLCVREKNCVMLTLLAAMMCCSFWRMGLKSRLLLRRPSKWG